MQEVVFTVVSNKKIAENIMNLKLSGDTKEITKPGQFINISIPGCFLRRPISVCDWENGSVRIIYKIVGKGTEILSGARKDAKLSALVGLGNGFQIDESIRENGRTPVLIGGGVGTPPMYGLAKELIRQGIKPEVILGFNTMNEIFLEEEFKKLGCKVTIATADGSKGVKGFVTDALNQVSAAPYFYACGPMPMLKAIKGYMVKLNVKGQFSLEERMGCGFGACMGCSIETLNGAKRVCKEGPVFKAEELLWN